MNGKRQDNSEEPDDSRPKKNPSVLRALLSDIVREEFGGDRVKASNALRTQHKYNGKHHPFSSDIIGNIINDRTLMKYVHLEAIAHYYRMPTSLLLLFSRLRSEREKSLTNTIDAASEVILLVNFLDGLREDIHEWHFGPDDLARWGQRYNASRLI